VPSISTVPSRLITGAITLIVVVNIPSSSISGYFIITKCTYSISRSAGPETSITLERDGAREINPTKPTDVVESAW